MLGSIGNRQLWRSLGWLAVGLSFGFIGLRLWQGPIWDLVRLRFELLLLVTIGGALIYGLAGFLLSAAWRQILGVERPPGAAAGYHAIYGRSQIAKYLPGNCFHFVGRQVLGRLLGHSQAALALASLIETALLIGIAASLALPLTLDRLGGWSIVLVAGAGLALALTLATPRLLPARLWPLRDARTNGGRLSAGCLLRVLALYGAFFGVAGSVVWLLATVVGAPQAASLDPLTSTSALALAWVAGFVTPGAPAGVGVREAVLMIALDGTLDPETSAAVALALRLVTTAGDGVFCALALALPLPHRPTGATAGPLPDTSCGT